MINQTVDDVKNEMGAIEALLKGLPGIRDYVDNELRRSADKRLREQIATRLTIQKQELLSVQKVLLRDGGLERLGEIDALVQRLQTVADRIQTASYGYSGLFSDVRIREEELDALLNFDRKLAEHVVQIERTVAVLADRDEQFEQAVQSLSDAIRAMDVDFLRRQEAILSPQRSFNTQAHEQTNR